MTFMVDMVISNYRRRCSEDRCNRLISPGAYFLSSVDSPHWNICAHCLRYNKIDDLIIPDFSNLHQLKIIPSFYQDVADGQKRWEYRKNDRNFKINDSVILREWNTEKYTGRILIYKIFYIVHGGVVDIPENYCIFSLIIP